MTETAYIQSILRAFEVLTLVQNQGTVRLADIVRHFDLKPPTAHNLLRTLVHAGALIRDGEDRYRIGGLLHWLGKGVSEEWQDTLRNRMRQLVENMPWATLLLTSVEERNVCARFRWSPGDPGTDAEPVHRVMGLYTSATGLVHLAFASEETRLTLMEATPFYEQGLHLWKSFEKLEIFLNTSRQQGYVVLPFPEPFFRAAVPVYAGNVLLGALGCSVRGEKAVQPDTCPEVVKNLRWAADMEQGHEP